MIKKITLFILLLQAVAGFAKEYHVSVKGNDGYAGSATKPFRTISKAASLAQPGDIITVHAGIYREQVTPPRGGTSDTKRITYRAAAGEKVEIKGSEIVQGWTRVKEDLWKVQLPYKFFGRYNPFTDKIYGDWYGGWLHTADVYLNNKPLSEDSLQKVFKGIPAMERWNNPKEMMPSSYTWCSKSDSGKTTIYARFGNYDPNKESVEVNVRPACFYPEQNHINYITVKGFHMSQAATQWAAPTAEQPGLIGTNWSKGWIIEDNVISNSRCTGITLGKDRTSGDNMWSKDPSIDGSLHYNELIHRVIANGWNKENIGSHIVKNNTIFNCGQAGICGSFGAAWSQIYGNNIYNIYTYRPFGGAEMAGIKLHGALDVLIKDNYIHNANLGIWLDWMAQGTRVSGNLMHDNDNVDLFVEVSHGPYLVENNIFLSTNAVQDWSQGGAYAHNLISGTIAAWKQGRRTPYFKPHTTEWLGLEDIGCGDDRFYNNVFNGSSVGAKPANAFFQAKYVPQNYGLDVYDKVRNPVVAAGNVYQNGAVAGKFETSVSRVERAPAALEFVSDGSVRLTWASPVQTGPWVTTELLGKAKIAKMGYENPDGSPLRLDADYFGMKRMGKGPVAGPFEKQTGVVKVWPKK